MGPLTTSGNEIGPFKAIEESTLAQLIPAEERSTIFAWYAVLSGIAASLGSLSGGWLTRLLREKHGWNQIQAYRVIFFIYTGCGIIKSLLSFVLSDKCEPVVRVNQVAAPDERTRLLDAERADQQAGAVEPAKKDKKPNIVDRILGLTPETRRKVYTLSALFGLDNLASGLVPLCVSVSLSRLSPLIW